MTYILKSDIRFHLNAHLNIYIGENTILKLASMWILRKFNLKKKSNFNCAILFKIAKHNLLHCLRNIINNHGTSSSSFYAIQF